MSQFESEVGDAELDALFAQAREPNEADAGAAERFLTGHRVRVAQAQTQAQIQSRPLWVRPRIPAKWLAAALASAAVIAGVGVLRPSLAPGDLPASAAYAAYQDALGEGW